MARQLLKKIDSVRRRAVLLVWIRSVCLALALTVLIGLLFLLLDGLLRSDSIGLRLFCLAGSFAAGIFAFAKWILPALNYRPRRVDIARRIEEASPDWKNELTTSVELASKPGDASNDLEYQLIDRTWHRLKQTPRSSFTNLQSIIGPASILAMVAAIGGLGVCRAEDDSATQPKTDRHAVVTSRLATTKRADILRYANTDCAG